MRSSPSEKLEDGSPAGELRLRARNAGRRLIAAMLLAALLFPLSARAPRADTASPESAVKIAFVFNFLKFIQWPAAAFHDAAEPVVVCVRSGSDLDGPLDALKNKLVQNRAVQVRRVAASDAQGGCHVTYYTNGLSR